MTNSQNNAIQKPKALPVKPENIPEALKVLCQWVVWKYELQNGKWKKPPFNAKTGHHAKTNDSNTWSGFNTAWNAYQSRQYDGIGFVLCNDIIGIDIDHCDEHKTIAMEICNRFKDITYCELSPSGKGLRIFCKGSIPKSGKGLSGYNFIEVYDKTSPRYLTVTGHTV